MPKMREDGRNVNSLGIAEATSQSMLSDTSENDDPKETWITYGGLRSLVALVDEIHRRKDVTPLGSTDGVAPGNKKRARRRRRSAGPSGGNGGESTHRRPESTQAMTCPKPPSDQ